MIAEILGFMDEKVNNVAFAHPFHCQAWLASLSEFCRESETNDRQDLAYTLDAHHNFPNKVNEVGKNWLERDVFPTDPFWALYRNCALPTRSLLTVENTESSPDLELLSVHDSLLIQ